MKGLCEKCGKRESCTKLCEEAEKYANQDYVEREEQLAIFNIENKEEETDYDIEYYDDGEYDLKRNKAMYRTAIINLFLDGKSTREIAYHVPYSQRQIVNIIQKYKKDEQF